MLKQLERSLPVFTLFVTYVQESSKEVFYVYAYSMPTSSSFSWVPKHDNNAQVRMFIKEAPVPQGLLKGFRHYKTGPGQDGSFQKAAETTMSLQYVRTFHTTVSSLSCYEIDTGVLT